MSQPTVLNEDRPVEAAHLGKVIAGLSHRLQPEILGTGSLAALRRISGGHLPPAFWKLYLEAVPASWRQSNFGAHEKVDLAWAALIRAMVEMAPRPHNAELAFGRQLGTTGYAEARFVRLLRAEGPDMARELRTASAWLAREGVKANWEQVAHLALGQPWLGLNVQPRPRAHRLARDFFQAQNQKLTAGHQEGESSQ